MQKPNFFDGQIVTAEDLNYIITSVTLEMTRRFRGLLGTSGGYGGSSYSAYTRSHAGILGSPGESSSVKNLKVTVGVFPALLNIASGYALDVNGELIYISIAQELIKDDYNSNYNWTSTTGTNYVKLSYSLVSGSLRANDIGVLYPTRYTSNWYISVNGTTPTNAEILLATFIGNSNGEIITGTITDTRLYARLFTFADAVGLDPLDIPVTSHNSVGDHIRAVGSGTPSTTNPHGLSVADLGPITGVSLSTDHATELHTNCIVPLYRNDACFDSYKGIVISPTVNAYVQFNAPSNAYILVDGQTINGSLASLSAADAYAINGNGTYYAVVDSSGNTSWQSTLTLDAVFTRYYSGAYRYSTGHITKEYFILGKAFVSDNGDNIDFWTDMRMFFGNHPEDISADFAESAANPNDITKALSTGSTIIDNLNRIRFQLGKAINGSPVFFAWRASHFPLTDGPTSNADSYHRHTFNNMLDIASTTTTAAKLAVLTAGPASVADAYHTHTNLKNYTSSFIPLGYQTFSAHSSDNSIYWDFNSGVDNFKVFDDLNIYPVAASGSTIPLSAGTYQITCNLSFSGTPSSGTGIDVQIIQININDNSILQSISYLHGPESFSPLVADTSNSSSLTIKATSSVNLSISGSFRGDLGINLFDGQLSIIKL